MKSASPLAATLLLHIALVVAVVTGLTSSHRKIVPPAPLSVALLLPAPAAPPTPLPAMAAKPPPPPQKKQPKPKPHIVPKAPTPIVQPHAEPAPAAKSVELPAEPRPAAPSPAPAPAAIAPPPPVPAPPVKTGVSISASYAASNRKPPYPRMSRANDEQGTVVLRVLVRADGSAGDVQIKTSSGYPLLDESAKAAVQSWHFNPATVDGKPIPQWYQVPIPFKLQDN